MLGHILIYLVIVQVGPSPSSEYASLAPTAFITKIDYLFQLTTNLKCKLFTKFIILVQQAIQEK
jgi:hypothetical protein